jgi:CHASE3 domain sensor protein
MAIGFMVDKSINKIISLTENTTDDYQDLSLLVNGMREAFGWIDKLESLKTKYSISGADKSIELMRDNKDTDSGKLSVTNIRDLLQNIKDKESERE